MCPKTMSMKPIDVLCRLPNVRTNETTRRLSGASTSPVDSLIRNRTIQLDESDLAPPSPDYKMDAVRSSPFTDTLLHSQPSFQSSPPRALTSDANTTQDLACSGTRLERFGSPAPSIDSDDEWVLLFCPDAAESYSLISFVGSCD